MVISGGNFKPDTLKPKEVVSLLLDDEEIEQKCKFYPILIKSDRYHFHEISQKKIYFQIVKGMRRKRDLQWKKVCD